MGKKDYQPLWDEMKRISGHKALLSLYLLNLSNEEPKEVRDHFVKFIDADDKLLVVKMTDAAANRCFQGTNDWIQVNCP